MRLALEVFEETGDQQALDRAVAAALEAVQILRQLDSVHCPDAGEVSWLTFVLPDLRDLARVLVSQAEDAAQTYLDSLWRTLALGTAPPAWGEAERTTAQTLVVFALFSPGGSGLSTPSASLHRMSAERWAAALVNGFGAGEERPWRRALGERYASVRHRCAPGGRFRARSRRLSELLPDENGLGPALRDRLSGWVRSGADPAALGTGFEAAVVHHRTASEYA